MQVWLFGGLTQSSFTCLPAFEAAFVANTSPGNHCPSTVPLTLTSPSCSEQGAVAMEVDACAEEAVSVALQASPEGEVRLQISPSQGPQGPRQGPAAGHRATQQHHRGDLSFLDPVNMADCPPTVSAGSQLQHTAGLVRHARRPAPACAGLPHARAGQQPYAACTGGLGMCAAQAALQGCQLAARGTQKRNVQFADRYHCRSGPHQDNNHILNKSGDVESTSADVQAVRLAAGELVLRIREEQRRRVIGNVCAASMQTRRMTGNKPGAPPCSDASQHPVNLGAGDPLSLTHCTWKICQCPRGHSALHAPGQWQLPVPCVGNPLLSCCILGKCALPLPASMFLQLLSTADKPTYDNRVNTLEANARQDSRDTEVTEYHTS